MKERPRVFDILRDTPGDAADQAFIDGLLEVSVDRQSEILDILLERGNQVGLNGLPALFNKLDPDLQTRIIDNTSRLFGALRNCIRSSSGQTRQNVLEIVRRSGNTRLAYLAGHAIHDGSPTIRAEAASTLRSLTIDHFSISRETLNALRAAAEDDPRLFRVVPPTLKLLRDEQEYLIKPLREALDHYESHYRPEVLEASMLMATQLEDGLFAHSTIKHGKLTHAMLEILASALEPRFVPFVYVALSHPELRRRIIPMITSCRNEAFFAEFIRWHWLARDPNIKKHLVAVKSVAWLDDGFEAAFRLPVEIMPKAPGWILALGLPSAQKVSLLTTFLILDNRKANRAAAWALTDIKTPGGTLALEGLRDHEDSAVQRIAKQELRHRARKGQHRKRKPDLRGRPEAWVNLLDRADLSEEFDAFWRGFEHVHPVQAKIAGHFAFKYVPGFETQIRVKLISNKPSDRLRALRLTMSLCVCDHFEKDVFALANDKSPEIRTASMAGLGQIGGETSRRILERALNDDAPAVQAAAIDALDRMEAHQRGQLIETKTNSENAEVRAAAVRCLLKMRVPSAAGALIAMLQDPRPDHRCASLWIVDQLRLTSISQRIFEVADSDPDHRIARIALHVARRLKRIHDARQAPRCAEVSP